MTMRVLSGGAANGLVMAFAGDLEAETGHGIDGDFGAVGARRERIMAGEAVDLIVLTRALIDDLVAAGMASASTVADLGNVATGIAVPRGAAKPDVSSPQALCAALQSADGIYSSDPAKATAAIHFKSVLEGLGIFDEIADRFHTFSGGQEAMVAMAVSDCSCPIGCTQITEILNVDGVDYVGDLPEPYDLVTMYSAAVASNAAQPKAAQRLIEMMTSESATEVRARKGFTA